MSPVELSLADSISPWLSSQGSWHIMVRWCHPTPLRMADSTFDLFTQHWEKNKPLNSVSGRSKGKKQGPSTSFYLLFQFLIFSLGKYSVMYVFPMQQAQYSAGPRKELLTKWVIDEHSHKNTRWSCILQQAFQRSFIFKPETEAGKIATVVQRNE